MTSLKSLLAAATPAKWTISRHSHWQILDQHGDTIATTDYAKDSELICRLRNAADAMLEYMQGGHHADCDSRVKFKSKEANGFIHGTCTCGYSALAKALGVSE